MCILFVEDEELIREIVSNELNFHGFEVRNSRTGDHAASLIEAEPMTFSMLITDIHMPGQRSGIHIARLMRQFNPELPIIFTTGRPDMISRFGPLGRNETLITKPYRAPELVEAILALLTD